MEPIAESLGVPDEHLQPYDAVSPSRFRKDVEGKSVIVSGGGYGIGASIARAFAEAGAKEVYLLGRTKSRLDETAATLSGSFKSTSFTTHSVDISSEADVDKFFASLSHSPDVLVNNAGYLASPASFVDGDFADFWKGFQINVYGTALITQRYLKHRKSKAQGAKPATVATLNTIASHAVDMPNLGSYAASKAALTRLNEVWAVEVPDTVARFVSIHPGMVETEMAAKSELAGAFPYTSPELAANFVVFTTTEQAGFLNGRFAFVNWDVEKLVAKKDEILSKNLLKSALKA